MTDVTVVKDLLASARSPDDLTKSIIKFFCDTPMEILRDTMQVRRVSDGKILAGVGVEVKAGRWRFYQTREVRS